MPRSSRKRDNAAPDEKVELEKMKFNLDLQKVRLDEDKSWFEFHKHMTTLNTGVIIIVATLIEKVFTNIGSRSFNIIAMSFYAFLGSITFSAIGLGYHMPSLRIVRPTQITKGSVIVYFLLKYARAFLLVSSLICFLLGIFLFVAFSLGTS